MFNLRTIPCMFHVYRKSYLPAISSFKKKHIQFSHPFPGIKLQPTHYLNWSINLRTLKPFFLKPHSWKLSVLLRCGNFLNLENWNFFLVHRKCFIMNNSLLIAKVSGTEFQVRGNSESEKCLFVKATDATDYFTYLC